MQPLQALTPPLTSSRSSELAQVATMEVLPLDKTKRLCALKCRLSKRHRKLLLASSRRKKSNASGLSMKLARRRSVKQRSVVRRRRDSEWQRKKPSVRDRKRLMLSACVRLKRRRCVSRSSRDSSN